MRKSRIHDVLPYLAGDVRCIFERLVGTENFRIEEIRLRAGAPLTIGIYGEGCFITAAGGLTNHEFDAYRVSQREVRDTFMAICENSVYAYMDEIRQGFITLKGGHRVGICGKAVTEDGKIKTFRDVSSLNIRISNEVLGVADGIADSVINGTQISNTLIVSPPQTGKTTLLRDLTRQISNRGFKTGIADDRGELAALCNGIPQNDVGAQTDIIDNAPKNEAVLMLLRTMSPRVIVTDEIACEKDVDALRLAYGTGVSVIATAHGTDKEDVMGRKILKPLFEDGIFKQIIVLNRASDFDSAPHTRSIRL